MSKIPARNGHFVPSNARRFGRVADILRSGNAAASFVEGAEILLDSFEVLSKEMGAAAVLKLAIDMHKHALFCEVAQDKTRTQHDAQAYAAFQQYLAGTSDIPVATGVTGKRAEAAAAAPNVDDVEEIVDEPKED